MVESGGRIIGSHSVWVADHVVALGDTGHGIEAGFGRSHYRRMLGRSGEVTSVTPEQYYGSNNQFMEPSPRWSSRCSR